VKVNRLFENPENIFQPQRAQRFLRKKLTGMKRIYRDKKEIIINDFVLSLVSPSSLLVSFSVFSVPSVANFSYLILATFFTK
jgi:hypothetical protein